MRDSWQSRTDVQSICSSAAESATPSVSTMSRGGATSALGGGGSSQHPFQPTAAVSAAQHYFSTTQNQLSNTAGGSSVSLIPNSVVRDFYGSIHALYGGSSSFALTTTNATNSATPPANTGGAPAPSPYCCECSTAQNRCSTDLCPCYASRRMCDEHCESAR